MIVCCVRCTKAVEAVDLTDKLCASCAVESRAEEALSVRVRRLQDACDAYKRMTGIDLLALTADEPWTCDDCHTVNPAGSGWCSKCEPEKHVRQKLVSGGGLDGCGTQGCPGCTRPDCTVCKRVCTHGNVIDLDSDPPFVCFKCLDTAWPPPGGGE